MKQETAQIKGMHEAVERILRAISSKERIILLGDADPDGVSAVIILEDAIKAVAGRKRPDITIYFPDRRKEGSGINKSALRFLKDKAPALFISLDCGMANVKEVARANKIGFEVIIIDHHKELSELPPALIIVNPKQKADDYPFKQMACGGIAYKLAKLLFLRGGKQWRPEEFLVLAMISTLFDQVPLKEDNKRLVKEGILALNYTKRKGLLALIEVSGFENVGIQEIVNKLLHPLSSWDSIDHLNEGYMLLTRTSKREAKKMAAFLVEKSREKSSKIREASEDLASMVKGGEILVFKGDKDWSLDLLGPMASIVCHRFRKPVFVFQKGRTYSSGSVRTPGSVDAVGAMRNCDQLLETYGGHAPAAGFKIRTKNLKQFEKCLLKYFKK